MNAELNFSAKDLADDISLIADLPSQLEIDKDDIGSQIQAIEAAKILVEAAADVINSYCAVTGDANTEVYILGWLRGIVSSASPHQSDIDGLLERLNRNAMVYSDHYQHIVKLLENYTGPIDVDRVQTFLMEKGISPDDAIEIAEMFVSEMF